MANTARYATTLLTVLVMLLALVGCDPKPNPQQRARVVGMNVKHHSNNRHRSRMMEKHEEQQEKPVEEKKFRLWADGPNFDTDLRQDVTALVGRSAYLTCRVFERGNKTVSWIRHHDLHILTVGRYTYTADLRFQSIYNSANDEWILQIKYVQKRDGGRYECQINTQPVRSYFVQLAVVDNLPENELQKMNDASGGSGTSSLSLDNTDYFSQEPIATIMGDSNVFMDVGSVLNLTCVVKHASSKPAFIIWRHGKETIDYSSPRGGISVETNTSGDTPTSYLLIDSVAPSDSGKYSCHPANAEDASVTVHILDGEHHAAIHTNGATMSSSLSVSTTTFLFWVLSTCSFSIFASSATLPLGLLASNFHLR